jgi:hypothetical protein
MYAASFCNLEEVLHGHEGFGVVAFVAGDLISLGFEVALVSNPADPVAGHAHAEAIYRDGLEGQIPARVRNRLAELAGQRVVVRPQR